MVDINDCEPCDAFRSLYRKSRKDRFCSCCHGPIAKGERYYAVTWVSDGVWSSFAQCEPCRELTEVLTDDLVFFSDLEGLVWDYEEGEHWVPVLRFRVRITKARLFRVDLSKYTEVRGAFVLASRAEDFSVACRDLHEALLESIPVEE